MRFYAELYVEQSPATVWSYFSDLTQWSRWSPICLECRLVEGVQLETGSVMRIRFRVVHLTTVVLANVISIREPNVITWTGTKFGLNAVHTYRFESRGSGTLMINEERIFGAPFPISHAIRRWYRTSDLSFQSLAGIKRELG
ncbi:MAG TPA: SRPBCC family protein [Pyrinomonadaceae bacterium]|nr:SRPBCC family protein [Pyrinomonadaceae bacterium]